MTALREDRVLAIVLGRCATTGSQSTAELANASFRFAPTRYSEADWRATTSRVLEDAKTKGILQADGRPTEKAVREHLGKSTGKVTWRQLADRVFPLAGLGVSAGDNKIAARIKDRDSWTAAIAGRLLGIWTEGAPPSLAMVCDAFAWRRLGLTGKPRRCPSEIRALFLQRELALDVAQPDRLLRLFIARELEAPRSELRALRDALVRRWLVDNAFEAHTSGRRSLVDAVVDATRRATHGVFGGRKVFVSAVWNDLRRDPSWSTLRLDDLKRELVAAHRAGHLVLARADLVAAMDPALVAASEISTDGASFHFIVREDG